MPRTVLESTAIELWDSVNNSLYSIPPKDETSDLTGYTYLFYHLFSLLEFMSARYLCTNSPTHDRMMNSCLSNNLTSINC